MQITIRAVLGIERADLNLSPLVLLAGVNGAGKSRLRWRPGDGQGW